MRKLIITRGAQGAGKSTALRQLGLEPYMLSGDGIRQLLAGPVLTRDGRVGISQENDRRVWPMLFDLLEDRMRRGELLVVDATHPKAGSFKPYLQRAAAHRYSVACLDFSTLPLEVCLQRNAQREAWKVVPEGSLRRTHAACLRGQVPEQVQRFVWQEDDSHMHQLAAWLEEPGLELSGYEAVVHVGDLQGCISPLIDGDGPFAGGLRDDTFYIFVGDYCDRGLENGRALAFILSVSGRPNVRLHWGNHEDSLHRWARGNPVRDPEFTERTAPQLLAAGITPEQVDALVDQLVELTLYRWRGQKVMVTHGGLTTVPEPAYSLAAQQCRFGVGYYHDPIHEVFSRQAPEGWVQVYGHRNPYALPTRAGPRCYNLEGQVEHGGELRLLTLDARGFTPSNLPSTHYRTLPQRIALKDPMADSPLNPPWVTADMGPPVVTPETLQALQEHPLVQEKPSISRPHISAFNFTRDAFFKREWDALNVTARGLFINPGTREVMARSYDKFFNVGERPETELGTLEHSLRFPVTLYLKENGYLGILGYDARDDSLVFASKSSLESDFAGWFRELAFEILDEGARVRLKRYLRDTGSSMAFEVVDPVRDPHIIEYDAAQLVLLDVIRRARDFERVPHKTLQKVGAHFGFAVKQRSMQFDDWRSLSGWLAVATQPDWLFQGEPVEGFVLEDSEGFLTKLKLDYYNHWKRMRSLIARVARTRGRKQGLGRDVSEPRTQAFYQWAKRQPLALLEKDIIVVRRAYLDGELPELPPEAEPVPVEDKDVRGFRMMLESLEGKGPQATIKVGTADGALRAVLADHRKLALLRASVARVPLVMAATPGELQEEAAELLGLDIG